MSLSTLIHSSGVAVFGYALYYDMYQVHVPRGLLRSGIMKSIVAFPGRWKYLTIWNLVLQVAYHSLALVNDIIVSYSSADEEEEVDEEEPPKVSWLQRLRDTVFASWALPVGSFVSSSFWALYHLDRNLVYPVEFDSIFPQWFNHAVHTAPLIFAVVGVWFIERKWPTRKVAIPTNLALSGVYSGWVTYVSLKTGIWPYQVLEVLNPLQKAAFISSSAVAIFGIYFVGEAVAKWRSEQLLLLRSSEREGLRSKISFDDDSDLYDKYDGAAGDVDNNIVKLAKKVKVK